MNVGVRKAREETLFEIDKEKAVDKFISDIIEKLKKCGLSDREARETLCRRCGKACKELKEKEKGGN